MRAASEDLPGQCACFAFSRRHHWLTGRPGTLTILYKDQVVRQRKWLQQSEVYEGRNMYIMVSVESESWRISHQEESLVLLSLRVSEAQLPARDTVGEAPCWWVALDLVLLWAWFFLVGRGLNEPQLPKTWEVFVSRHFWVHFCLSCGKNATSNAWKQRILKFWAIVGHSVPP